MDAMGMQPINVTSYQGTPRMTEQSTQKNNDQEAIGVTTQRRKETPNGQDSQEEKLIKAIEGANKKISKTENEFSFSVHEKTKQIMIKVINKNTKEVVKEFPPEKILDMVATMCETAGLFVDEKR